MNGSNLTSVLRNVLPAVLLALLAAAVSGCSGDYGRLNRDTELTAAFAENRFPSNYRYFYIGRSSMPYAIVGVREGYEFRSKFWTPVDPASETFQKMVRNPYGSDASRPYGAYLLDEKGNRVGLVYTAFDLVDFRVTDDKGVYVFDPYRPTGAYRHPSQS